MGKYDALRPFFRSVEDDEITIDLAELERILGWSLPASARRHPAWWSSAQPHATWSKEGFRASPDLVSERVTFRRTRTDVAAPSIETPDGDDGRRLVLLGCVSQKRPVASPASDLYVSPLWRGRRSYAATSGQPWAILSAEYGLVRPDEMIEPYDRSLKDEPAGYRRRWSEQTAAAVVDMARQYDVSRVELHAGAAYLEHGLVAALERAGLETLRPLREMRIGEQLSWYRSRQLSSRGAPGSSSPPAANQLSASREEPAVASTQLAPSPVIVEMRKLGSFQYRWPDSTEGFEYGWEGRCRIGDEIAGFRHGIGSRVVYGRQRVHTVTWLRGEPVVEGVGADDFPRSQSLLSMIKDGAGRMVRSRSEVPPGYDALAVVDHRSEIDARYSRNGLAAKVRVDDVAGWLRHATLRRERGDRRKDLGRAAVTSIAAEPDDGLERVVGFEPLPSEQKRRVAEALIAFGETAEAQLSTGDGSVEFAEDEEANALLRDNPFAFLVGVIVDQGIRAERAWAVPKQLERRLGHLDPRRVVDDPRSVFAAFVEPSALHRYVNTMPEWVVAAAGLVVDDYGGDAGRIWADTPAAGALQARLRRFPGIGQKKAAMAVEMLERDFGVEVTAMGGSDIAYDVHVRRVFLRTGLAERDDSAHMVEEARTVYPERPGALDAPAWVVGRTWCRPGVPDCPECALVGVCPRRIEVGDRVRGA